MKYHRDLQVRLQERYRRLFKATYSSFPAETQYFREFLRCAPALWAIVNTIIESEGDLDPQQWIDANFDHYQYRWPQTEIGRAKVAWHLLNLWADSEDANVYTTVFSTENNLDACIRDMTEAVLEPFVDFLQEHLAVESDTLYLLERYSRQVEWFDREDLYSRYSSDTARGEAVYDRHLRRFLFAQGVDYPFSQPASASGIADVVSAVDTDDPLVCEIKLFDGDRYSTSYIAKGVRQVLEYAKDYGKVVGHLVICNLTDRVVLLPSDSPASDWPARLAIGEITVHLVQVRARPETAASRLGKVDPIVLERNDLVAS